VLRFISQKGNSPDYLLRFLKIIKCKICEKILTTEKSAWKQPSFKESVTAHWSSSFFAVKMYGTQIIFTEAIDLNNEVYLNGSRTFCNF
jgi:hypothetical protein